MNIHVYCRNFSPSVGGMEKLAETLALEFVAQGHAVQVVTETVGECSLPLVIHRNPTFREYIKIAKESDVILSSPLSLRRLPAQILSGRKIFVSHPDRLGGEGLARLFSLFKRIIARKFINIVPSNYMARYFHKAVVIWNPYEETQFYRPAALTPRYGIIFVGRLVKHKGVHTLIEAFSRLPPIFGNHHLSVVGDGPELDSLIRLSQELRLGDRVRFTGAIRGDALTKIMQEHLVMVVPTTTEEPFGIVALEGLACGCRMIVSRSGGLPEAVGDNALLFTPGDLDQLTSCLISSFAIGNVEEKNNIDQFLQKFRPNVVAKQYLALFEEK